MVTLLGCPSTISSILLFLANSQQFSPSFRSSKSWYVVMRQSKMMVSWLRDSMFQGVTLSVREAKRSLMKDLVVQMVQEGLQGIPTQSLQSQVEYRVKYYQVILVIFQQSADYLYRVQNLVFKKSQYSMDRTLLILCITVEEQRLMRRLQTGISRFSLIRWMNLKRNRQKWIQARRSLEMYFRFSRSSSSLGASLVIVIWVMFSVSMLLRWFQLIVFLPPLDGDPLSLMEMFCLYFKVLVSRTSKAEGTVLRDTLTYLLMFMDPNQNLWRSQALRRLFLLHWRHPMMNSERRGGHPLGINSWILSASIFLNNSFSVFAAQGVFEQIISKQITPRAHISLSKEYSFLLKDSGGMQRGDPTLYLVVLLASLSLIENPKSAIFNSSPFMRILAGFKSLWMIWCWKSWLYPSRSCPMKNSTSCSLSLFLILAERSLSQSSVMRQVLFLVVNISQSWRICSVLFSLFRFSISEARSILFKSFLSIFISITLIATGSLVRSFLPLNTWLEQPLPMISSRGYEQFSNFFLVPGWQPVGDLEEISEGVEASILIGFYSNYSIKIKVYQVYKQNIYQVYEGGGLN